MHSMRKIPVHYAPRIRAGESWSPTSLMNLTDTYSSLHLKEPDRMNLDKIYRAITEMVQVFKANNLAGGKQKW